MSEQSTKPARQSPAWMKTVTDFGPLIAFFIANWLGGIYWATGVLMLAIVIAGWAAYHFNILNLLVFRFLLKFF